MTSSKRPAGGESDSGTGTGFTANHWGTYRFEVAEGQLRALHDFEGDPDPSPIGPGIVDVLDDQLRIRQPMVRKHWLENGPGGGGELRGRDAYVAVSWERALDLAASELERVRTQFGNESIYAGSYGWSSAGRFHHAKSQLKRFLGQLGGFVDQRHTYSNAAGHAIGSEAQ